MPAFGYVQYTLDTKGNSAKNLEKKNTLENEFYAINVEEDGSLTITDKENNVTYKNQGVLVENGDDGDSFNYSPPRKDLEVFSNKSECSVEVSGSDIYDQAVIKFNMVVPKDLEERAEGKVSVNLPITMTVALRKDTKVYHTVYVYYLTARLFHHLTMLMNSSVQLNVQTTMKRK